MVQRHFRDEKYWALILGGSSGFGLAAAKRLAAEGFNLAIGHRDSQARVQSELNPAFAALRSEGVEVISYNGNLAEDEGRGEFFNLISDKVPKGKLFLFLHSLADGACKPLISPMRDEAKGKAIKQLAETLKISPVALQEAINSNFHDNGCDALVDLADTRIPYPAEDLSENELDRTAKVMGHDFLLWSRELLRAQLLAPKARLVGLTSAGNEKAWTGYAAVSAAKTALESLCRSMAVEFAPYDLRSCIVQPGITDTPAGNGIPYFDIAKAHARLRNPFHRLTQVEEVADVVYGLCLPNFDWVNGTVLRVDGGEAIAA